MNRVLVGVARAQMRDVLRGRWVLAYFGFFVLLTEGLLRFSDTQAKAFLSLATATTMVIPLAILVLATIYLYNAREFTELLLAQPIRREALFAGLYLGLAVPATLAFVAGVAVPFTLHGLEAGGVGDLAAILAVGIALTLICGGVAFCIALAVNDRLRGAGLALGLWLLAAVVYDGAVLAGVAMFGDYPIERPLLGLMFGNPFDLARVLLLMRLDAAAMLGYTGAVFERAFGRTGAVIGAVVLLAWIAAPMNAARRMFVKKDF